MKKILRFLPLLAAVALLAANTGCTAKVKKAYHERRADKFYAAGQFDRAEIEYLNVLRADHEDAKAFARLGDIYFDQGRFQTAAPFLNRASELATNDLDVQLKLGKIFAAAGELKKARAAADFILSRDPKNAQAPLLLAQSIATQKDADAVRDQLEKLQKSGDSAPLEIALGTLAFRSKDFSGAETDLKRALALDPKSADAFESLGALYSAQGDAKNAEVNFKAASDLSSPRSTPRMYYARFKMQLGAIDEAKQILNDTVKQSPDYIPALMGLGEIALAQTNFDECRSLLTQVLSRDPNNFDGQMLQARLDFMQGNVAEAVTTLERLTKIYPQASRVYFQLAAADLATGDDAKAMVNLNRALELDPNFVEAILLQSEIQIKNKNPDPVIFSLGKLTQQNPQLVQGQLLLADAYRLRNRTGDALAIYNALQKTHPKNSQIALLAGSAYLQSGDKIHARQEFETAFAAAPNDLPALEQLIDLDLNETNFAGAMQRVQAKLKDSPNDLTVRLLLAKVQLASGDRAATEKTLLDAIDLDPKSDSAYLLLAQLHLDMGQNDKARENLQTAISRNTNNLPAMISLATMDQNAGDNKNAAALYEKILALSPQCSPALNNLAYIYSEFLNNLDRAYDLAQQARQLLPFDPSTADTLGWILFKRGSYPAAAGLLAESAAKSPDQPEIQFHFGMANYMTGDEADARAGFQRALQSGKDFRGHDECQLCLSLLDINPQTADADAQKKLEKRIAEKSDDPIANGRLGAIYQRAGNSDQAIGCYEAVLKSDPKNLSAMKNLAALYESKNPAKAYDYAKSAYKLAPDDAQTGRLYGRLAYQNGDYKLASAILQNAVQNLPGDAVAQLDLARAVYSLGKISMAQTALQSALTGNLPAPDLAEAKQMSDLISAANDAQAATAAAGRVAEILKTQPDDVPALFVQAKIKEQSGDAAAAAAACEKILAKFPDFTPAERELAILYCKDSDKNKAAYSLAMKARADFPNDPALAKATAIILFGQGDFLRAENLLKGMGTSSDPEFFYYLGAAQFKLKDHAAKANLQQALALQLSGAPADSARKMLADLK